MTSNELSEPPTTALRTVARLALSGVLVLAGPSHLFGSSPHSSSQCSRETAPNTATSRDAFVLNTDRRRFIRLLFQLALIAWALWSTVIPTPNR